MARSAEIRAYTPIGEGLGSIGGAAAAEWARKERQVGRLSLTIPDADLDPAWLRLDTQFEILVSADGGPPLRDGEARYLLRGWRWSRDANGRIIWTLRAADGVDLLRRRIIAYAAGSAQAAKSATAADNLIKAFVRENTDTLATDAARRYAATFWAIDADTSAGPSIAKSAPRRNLLTVCQEIADAAATAGVYTTFDVIYDGSLFRLRTYTGQRGVDRRRTTSAQPLLLGGRYGTSGAAELDYAAEEEATYLYAAGQGEGNARAVATAENTARSGLSPFGRIEALQDARNTSSSAALQDEADSALRERRPRQTFTATFLDTESIRWGVDVGFGDYVTVEDADGLFDCRIDGYSGNLSPDRGLVYAAQLRSE
jgi:hypothetical protein